MNKYRLFFLSLLVHGSAVGVPLVGVDFSNELGGNSTTPEDRNLADQVTVSNWTFGGTGAVLFDANANTGRPSPPVGKFNGPTTTGVAPTVGSPPPTDGIHSLSLTFGAGPITLTNVSFDFSAATGSANQRWIAFRTSLDDNIIYSQVGPARPNFLSVAIDLNGAKYSDLANQTVDFIWYCGGEGSGDLDIDSIVIEGQSKSDADADGIPDDFEQIIIGADTEDSLNTIFDVLPGDDFDSDSSTNLNEYNVGTSPINPDSDNDTLLDGIESNTGNFIDLATDTGTDPLDDDSDDDGLKDGVETNDGTFDDLLTDTGTNPAEPDTDFDGIPDGYEVNNGLSVFVGDSGLDPDEDDSTNLQEFTNGTLVNNPDTDGDGYRDGIETNDSTFDDVDADTGTDPLDADTDDDGWLDGVETNSGTFSDINDTGTSPLNEDSDSDNFRDRAEVLYHGTNPTDGGSIPTTDFDVLFMEANGTGMIGADEFAIHFLQDKFGIAGKVIVAQASTILTGDELAYDLLVTSSTPGSGDIRGKFINSVVPIVNWEEAVIDNGAGEFGAASAIIAKSNETTEIVLNDHPIKGNLSEEVTLYSGTIGETGSSAAPFPGIAIVGTAGNGLATAGSATEIGNDVTGYAMIFAIEAGDAVDPNTGTTNNVAPARRVMLPFSDGTFALLSADAIALTSNAIDWALGILGSPIQLAVVNFEIDSSTPGSPTGSLQFSSRGGQTYTIFASTELSVLASGDGDLIATVTGAEGTTTVPLPTLQVSDPKRFFVVREGSE